MKLGERIKEIRVSKGMTQLELAEKSGIALRTVQRIENNEVTPSFYSLNAIGEALDIKLNADLFIETDNKFEFKIKFFESDLTTSPYILLYIYIYYIIK